MNDGAHGKTGISRRATLGTIGGLAAVVAAGTSRTLAQEATPEVKVPTPDTSLAFKVVLHVAAPSGWPPALSNLSHLTSTYPNADVLCVVDGTAIYVLQGTNDFVAKMAEVAKAGAKFQVCAAALKEHQIDPATMPSFYELVAGGVVALVQAEAAGYAYVRP